MDHKITTEHYKFALSYAKSLQIANGRSNVDKVQFVKMLSKYADKNGIFKITKLRCIDIDDLIHVVKTPKMSPDYQV